MHHGDNINWLHSILKHFCVGDLVVWVWTRIRYNIYLEISFIWVFWWLLRKKSVWCSSDSLLGFSDVSYKLNCFLRHVLMLSFPSFLCKLFAGDTDVPLCQLPPAILHLHHCWPSNNLFRNLILLPPFWDFLLEFGEYFDFSHKTQNSCYCSWWMTIHIAHRIAVANFKKIGISEMILRDLQHWQSATFYWTSQIAELTRHRYQSVKLFLKRGRGSVKPSSKQTERSQTLQGWESFGLLIITRVISEYYPTILW